MTGRARVFVLLAMVMCLLVMTTGVLLLLHLSACNHPKDHDYSKCPICQKILAGVDKYSLEHKFKLQGLDLYPQHSFPRWNIYGALLSSESIVPRAPPFHC